MEIQKQNPVNRMLKRSPEQMDQGKQTETMKKGGITNGHLYVKNLV